MLSSLMSPFSLVSILLCGDEEHDTYCLALKGIKYRRVYSYHRYAVSKPFTSYGPLCDIIAGVW